MYPADRSTVESNWTVLSGQEKLSLDSLIENYCTLGITLINKQENHTCDNLQEAKNSEEVQHSSVEDSGSQSQPHLQGDDEEQSNPEEISFV